MTSDRCNWLSTSFCCTYKIQINNETFKGMTFKCHTTSAVLSLVRSPVLSIRDWKSRLHLFSDKNSMTSKVDQGHWQWHNSSGHNATYHFLLVVYSNRVSILYHFQDIWRWRMLWPWNWDIGVTHVRIYAWSVHRWNLQTRDYLSAVHSMYRSIFFSLLRTASSGKTYIANGAALRWKPHTLISFDASLVCDGRTDRQTDKRAAYNYIAL